MIQEFPLRARNPAVTLMTRFAVAFVVTGEAVILGLYAAGLGPADAAIISALFVAALGGAVAWWMRKTHRGAAEIHPDRLLVRTAAVTQLNPWKDIKRVEVIRLRDAGRLTRLMYAAFGVAVDEPYVRIRLRRSLRPSLFRDRIGTDVIGIPAPGMKETGLFLEDPDSFAAAAIPYLQAAGSYEP
jgi:hypothetical protein